MSTSVTINLSPAEQAEFNKRTSGRGLTIEAVVATMLRQFLIIPVEVAASLPDYAFANPAAQVNIWEHHAAQVRAKAQKDLATDVAFNLSAPERKEFSQRTANRPQTPQAVAKALFEQFLRGAPPEAIDFIAGQNSGGGDLWAHLETATRGKVRQELGTDLDLAKAVRAVMASKATS